MIYAATGVGLLSNFKTKILHSKGVVDCEVIHASESRELRGGLGRVLQLCLLFGEPLTS